MPSKYTLDTDLKKIVFAKKFKSTARCIEARKEAKATLEERFKTNKTP